MSVRFIAFFAIVLLLHACTNDKKETGAVAVTDTTAQTDKILLTPNSETYAAWDEFYSQHDLAFTLDSFALADTFVGELHTQSYRPTDSFYSTYGKLLVYNKDSSKIIDAYSSGWIVETDKQGKIHAREAEADQEVVVIDVKKGTKTRLLFCGPGCQVQKTFWYNDHVVGIMGLMAEYADEYYTPAVWFVDINNGITIPYQYNASVSIIHAEEYMKRTLEARGIVVD